MPDPKKKLDLSAGNAILKSSQKIDLSAGDAILKKKRIFSAYFTRRCVGIKLTTQGCVYFVGYRSTDTSTGIGYFRWRTA